MSIATSVGNARRQIVGHFVLAKTPHQIART